MPNIGFCDNLILSFGFFTGKIISVFGHRKEAYVDAEEFMDAEE
jgi:hypothetical protein